MTSLNKQNDAKKKPIRTIQVKLPGENDKNSHDIMDSLAKACEGIKFPNIQSPFEEAIKQIQGLPRVESMIDTSFMKSFQDSQEMIKKSISENSLSTSLAGISSAMKQIEATQSQSILKHLEQLNSTPSIQIPPIPTFDLPSEAQRNFKIAMREAEDKKNQRLAYEKIIDLPDTQLQIVTVLNQHLNISMKTAEIQNLQFEAQTAQGKETKKYFWIGLFVSLLAPFLTIYVDSIVRPNNDEKIAQLLERLASKTSEQETPIPLEKIIDIPFAPAIYQVP